MPRPRRIALFTGNYVSLVDGVSLTLNRLVRHLESLGDEVLVFGPGSRKGYALEPAGRFVPVFSLPFWLQPEYELALGVGFGRELARFQPDLVHLATPDVLGHAALYWSKARGLTTVGSFHSNVVSYLDYVGNARPNETMAWAWLRNFYNSCAHTYVPTESMAEELKAHGLTGLRLWDRGVDLDRFNPEHRSEAFRASYGIAPDEKIVAFVARLRWEKGLRPLASILQGLEASGIKHRAMIVGDGVGREFLEESLPNAVFTGELKGEDLPTAYASADVFLYPSATDTFGNVTLEAMASGLPTVCADAPGAKSIVVDRRTGLLCTPQDSGGFQAAVEQLLRDESLRLRMSEAALQRARKYTWDRAMGRIVDAYDELIGPRD